MRNVEEAIAQNAKGILASTMKEEINQLVKESLSEQDMEDEIELDTDIDTDMPVDNDDDMEMDMEFDMDMDMDSEESPIDLTDASDEEILKVFKAMGEEDGIIVKKDGEDIHLSDTDTDSEYLVKLGESEEEIDEMMDLEEMDDMDVDTEDVINAIFSKDGDVEDFDMDQEEEVMYEIEFDEEEEMYEGDDEMMEEDEDMMEEEDEDMMESDDEDMMEEEDDDMMEEEDLDESYNHRRAVREAKSTVKPKGVGIGSGPKFTYKDKAKGGFDEKKKEGPKSVGTGKPKFEYKKGENMEQKSKVVKAETKEGTKKVIL